MVYEKIDLYAYFGLKRGKGEAGFVQTYVQHATPELKRKIRPAMLVIPGGGYKMRSDREGEPVALKYAVNGYASFVLEYSINTPYPAPLLEACMAVIYIRENAEKYSVSKNHIAAIGFSAGGHLAAMLANMYNDKQIEAIHGERSPLARPDAVILSYPVISSEAYGHGVTFETISGGDNALREKLSLEKRVTKDSSPAFIWHTAEDNIVNVENAIVYARACKKAGVPFALHIFEKGWHGLSLCNFETHNFAEEETRLEYVGKWFELSLDWLKARGFAVRAEK